MKLVRKSFSFLFIPKVAGKIINFQGAWEPKAQAPLLEGWYASVTAWAKGQWHTLCRPITKHEFFFFNFSFFFNRSDESAECFFFFINLQSIHQHFVSAEKKVYFDIILEDLYSLGYPYTFKVLLIWKHGNTYFYNLVKDNMFQKYFYTLSVACLILFATMIVEEKFNRDSLKRLECSKQNISKRDMHSKQWISSRLLRLILTSLRMKKKAGFNMIDGFSFAPAFIW